MDKSPEKRAAAQAALAYIKPGMTIGVGSGSTVCYFIEALANIKHKIDGVVAASQQTEKLLTLHSISLCNLNDVKELPVYIDSADEINGHLQMIKGGGGSLTREKIIANAAEQFICIADKSKQVSALGKFPVAVEVIPMARSFVARHIVKLSGNPVYREGFITDNGHVILDVWHLDITDALNLEKTLNNIPGVVDNGLFAARRADILLLASEREVNTIT